jgi:hypothetical protein
MHLLMPGMAEAIDSMPSTESRCPCSSSAALDAPNTSKETTPESDMAVDRVVTPPPQLQANGARSYLDSPSATKRKRMEELAEQRRTKKHL